jgi:hypothetical protein
VSYGHGNNKTGKEKASILHPDLKTIPHQPQVQLIGNGKVPGDYEGLESVSLEVWPELTLLTMIASAQTPTSQDIPQGASKRAGRSSGYH